MRQALGKLGTAKAGKSEPPRRASYQAQPGAGRHRFRQDGEVPVVRLTLAQGDRSGGRQPLAPVGTMGAVQGKTGEGYNQGGGESARQLQELTKQLRATQTRLGHAEMALGETARAAWEQKEETTGLRQALHAAELALAQVRAELVASERARADLEQRRDATRDSSLKVDERDNTAMRRKVGRPLGSTNRVPAQGSDDEPEPVRWWAGD